MNKFLFDQDFDVTIESLGGLGDGIATLNGKPLFVPKSCPGDRLKVRITHQNHDGYQGAISDIITAGPARAAPPCPHFSVCGGCRLQQLAPEDYKAFKTRMLHSALKQAGCPNSATSRANPSPIRGEARWVANGTSDVPLRPHPSMVKKRHPDVVFSTIEPPPNGEGIPSVKLSVEYNVNNAEVIFIGERSRRRVEFQLAKSGGKVAIAFNELRTNHAHAIASCHLVEPAIEALIAPLGEALSALPFAHDISSVGVTAADSGMDLVLTLRNGQNDGASLAMTTEKLNLARISIRHAGGVLETIIERSPVTIRLGDYDIALPPDSFLQATRKGQELLTRAALDATRSATKIADLFCGIGTYSFPLSQSADVLAVESDSPMVNNLRANIKKHGIKTLTAQQRDLFRNPLSAEELRKFQAVVVNPPRIGAKAQTEQLAQSGIPIIVMISCNPATFARDARILLNSGYRMMHAQGIDQFVWSQHLEIIAVFGYI